MLKVLFTISGMPGNFNVFTEAESVSEINQEDEEEVLLDVIDILDNLKQEEQITEYTVLNSTQHIQSEDESVQFSCQKIENFGNVSNEEIEEADDSKQEVHDHPLIKKSTVHLPKLSDAFVRKYTRSAHVHKNIRFNCDKCEKSFARKDRLTLHIQSVHENVQYNCDLCNKSFSRIEAPHHVCTW